MAILRQRLCRKNSSGNYDTVHLETSSDMVLMTDGTTVEAAINSKADALITDDDDSTAKYRLGVSSGSLYIEDVE